ncbi:unnamed protein product, partial [Timema podura]|nr:unnamed protein product [Timema podura]
IVYELILSGANVNETDNLNYAPLHWSVLNTSYVISKLLILKGAHVNAINTFEETPLHIAILRSPSKVITILLLRSGAYHDPKSGNSMGLLMELALQASSTWHIDVIKLLVRHGAQLKVVEPLGKRSLLHIVAMTGYLPLASYLLEEGVNVYARNLQRKTPLQLLNYSHETEFDPDSLLHRKILRPGISGSVARNSGH